MYNHGKLWGVRPSELLDLDDPYEAYCLDEAAAYLGNTIQADLNGVDASTPQAAEQETQKILDSYFRPKEEKPRTGMYADPALLFAR